MISFTSAQLDAWLAALIYPLTRILALIATAPVIGNKQVPVRVKVGLALILTIVIAPTLGELPPVSVGSAPGMLILVQQIIIGVAMGYTMRMIFTAVEMAGDLAGMQMGLGFASFFDPVNASFTPILAQWMGVVASLAFLAFNGHLFMLMGLADSFHTLPIGQMMPHAAYFDIAAWGGNIFAYALQISLPLLTALLITNIALAILTRAAPQLNLFAVGFPVTLSMGLVILALSMPYFAPLLDKITHDALDTMLKIGRAVP